ncbi:PfkB family carbohydrate kinase [Amycolatopsis sp. QT-25]|uniref:carbohydrate kinase family protein n=1 Tax=Amycolatopsis sp. QT-25 TaxID=3034022 RepID=UPI0023ECFE56|nr:PfkB family carbohydrate kinase [Amycolatopsis sp. QT-25]WET81981.1 PfkB family carbohydrate kinase [Amycolatopsis sp. QT-25]
MSGGGIVVVGDVGLDVVARHEGPIPHGGDIRAKVHFTSGGAGANTALWLRAEDAETTLVARIGNDSGGRMVRGELEAAGVRCEFAVDPAEPTFCVVVLVDGAGERSMLADRGANARFSPEDVTEAALDGASHLHLSGYVLLYPSSRPAALASLAAAKKAGLTTSVDPQAATLITDPAAFLDDVRGVDLLMPNTSELVALTGSSDPEAAKDLLDHVGEVVVTAGLDGASWVDAGGTITSVPSQPAKCVDSTGAGDAFDAGVLAAWLRGESTVEVLRAGARLGARAVAKVGPQP